MKKRKIMRRQVYPTSYDPIDKLELMKGNGKKEVFWSLTKPMKEYYEEYGFTIEPYLYLVHTKRFSKEILSHSCSFVKELHYGAIKGKKYITCKIRNGYNNYLQASIQSS